MNEIFLLIFSLILIVVGVVILSIPYSDTDFDTSGKYILGGVILSFGIVIISIITYLFLKRRKIQLFVEKARICQMDTKHLVQTTNA